jgi:hypothetical protein
VLHQRTDRLIPLDGMGDHVPRGRTHRGHGISPLVLSNDLLRSVPRVIGLNRL